jgi:N6-L-threonylcarbamoyladenine synthase
MNVLGIETSCDDTSLALYDTDRGLLENVTAGQLVHEDFGGVVPELASRQHLKALPVVYEKLLERARVRQEDIGGIGVSNGPGLVGSLLVGVGFAKSLAWSLGIPVVGVHHIEAHILSNELGGTPLSYPCVVLVVSGGHTQLFHVPAPGMYTLAGNTRDDAAGEAFDKIAKLLGLGFPGGPAIQRTAERGRPDAVDFPRAMRERGNFEFSFSGLKTAVRLHVESLADAGRLDDGAVADVAASAQAAIVDVLVEKTVACARSHGVGHVYIAGGVAANGPLRERLAAACGEAGPTGGIEFHAPLLEYCTDNGAMVARTAAVHLQTGRDDGHALDVFARGRLGA